MPGGVQTYAASSLLGAEPATACSPDRRLPSDTEGDQLSRAIAASLESLHFEDQLALAIEASLREAATRSDDEEGHAALPTEELEVLRRGRASPLPDGGYDSVGLPTEELEVLRRGRASPLPDAGYDSSGTPTQGVGHPVLPGEWAHDGGGGADAAAVLPASPPRSSDPLLSQSPHGSHDGATRESDGHALSGQHLLGGRFFPAADSFGWPRAAGLAALAAVTSAVGLLARSVLPFEDCAICCVSTFSLLLHRNSECTHRCCAGCWRGYLRAGEADGVFRMRHARAYTLTCWGCAAPLGRRTLGWFGTPALRQCVQLLERRQALIRTKPARFTIVECRRMGCVGVGYDDGRSPTIMCFLCTEQWAIERGVLAGIWALAQRWWPKRIDGVTGWRPCPHCGAAILKNGGCPMMRCALCRRTFRWGATHNTTHDVIEAHAPN